MIAKKVLFPTDLSETSQTALDTAAALAAESNGKLLILHVVEPVSMAVPNEMYMPPMDAELDELRKALDKVAPTRAKIPCEHRLIVGNPAETIVQIANDEHFDLIVMATHGRSALMHLLMGSVAEHVVRNATCPVLTLRQKK
jgi:nucleotide-binding universal stress UspA family protein